MKNDTFTFINDAEAQAIIGAEDEKLLHPDCYSNFRVWPPMVDACAATEREHGAAYDNRVLALMGLTSAQGKYLRYAAEKYRDAEKKKAQDADMLTRGFFRLCLETVPKIKKLEIGSYVELVFCGVNTIIGVSGSRQQEPILCRVGENVLFPPKCRARGYGYFNLATRDGGVFYKPTEKPKAARKGKP